LCAGLGTASTFTTLLFAKFCVELWQQPVFFGRDKPDSVRRGGSDGGDGDEPGGDDKPPRPPRRNNLKQRWDEIVNSLTPEEMEELGQQIIDANEGVEPLPIDQTAVDVTERAIAFTAGQLEGVVGAPEP
jgi:hypothetical protein